MWYSVALWLASISSAEGKSCTPPELPRFSKAITSIQESYEQGSYFYYKCDEGYHFESNTNHHKIVCDNTHWQPINLWRCYDACNNACGSHGTCVKTLGEKSTEETSTICQCDKNYAGKHCDARVCESEPIGPHHLQPQLEVGTKPVNGKYPLGALIHYRCENNYVIKSGRTTAHCEAEGWVPSQVPICEVSTCSSKKFESGMFSPMLPSYRPGDVITFSCYDGYVLIGEKKAVCANGFWSREWPSCVKSCKRQPFPNGELSPVQDYYRPTEYVHFRCHNDYQLSAGSSQQLICREQGWSSMWPTCERIKYCSDPPRVKNAIMQDLRTSYPVGSVVTYECLKLYVMNKRRGAIYCSFGDDDEPVWDRPPVCTTACRPGERMIRKQGDREKFYCESKPIITTTVTSSVKPLTIVTATAGALLLLLLIVISLVAYQRRRIALTSRRQGRERLTNEDDRYSFVYYSNDVHVVLPSYDEAMRVQGAPPPYNVDATTGAVTTASSGSSGADGAGLETGRREQEATLSSLPSSMEVIYDAIDDLAAPCYNTLQQRNELIQATSASASGLSTNNNTHKETGNESVRKSIRDNRDNNNLMNNSGDNSNMDCSSSRETHHDGDNGNNGDGFIVNSGETNSNIVNGENSNFPNDDDGDYISIGSGSGYSDTDQLIGD